jgi:hypothetical protein
MNDLARTMAQPGTTIDVPDDLDAINELYLERGWSDGLPIVPPTEARVAGMLKFCDRPIDQPIAAIPPRYGAATPWRLATCAVMAGCRPEYFPLILLAIETMCEEPLNLYGVQATTHPCAPLVIVNGPVAQELGINAGHNAFGPCTRANATIGRAIRLALLNIGGAIPAVGDMATMGTPAKYTYVVAENEAASPWEPLHVERGFARETSTVTVVGAEGPHNINDHESVTALGILKMVVGTVAITGGNDVYYDGAEPLIVFSPEHAATVAREGHSKADVKQFLFEHARLPLMAFSNENVERRFRVKFPHLARAGLETLVPIAQRAEDYMIVVVGGAGKHSAFIPTFGGTRSVTRPLKLASGALATSIQEFRNG